MAASLLTACGQQKSQSKQTSQTKHESVSVKQKSQSSKRANATKKTPAKAVDQPKQMDLDQIQAGDYSSIIGQWHIVKMEARGQDLTLDGVQPLNITKDNLVDASFTLNKDGLKDKAGIHPVNFKVADKVLTTRLNNAGDVAINWTVTFYPIGTSHDYGVNVGEKTNQQNTIVIWSSSGAMTAVYAQDQPKTAKTTGWTTAKDQKLATFIEQWEKTMDQHYVKYNGHDDLKTNVGGVYPSGLTKEVMDGQRGVVGWSADGKGQYPYNVVALYYYTPTSQGTLGGILYGFAFHNGQPIVLVNQSTNGESTWTETKNEQLKTAFTEIANE